MKFSINISNLEQFELDYDTALDLVMKALCKEHGWDAHISVAQTRRNRLSKSPDDLAEELHYVPFCEVVNHLEPKPTDWLLDFDKSERLWVNPDITHIELQVTNTLTAYGW